MDHNSNSISGDLFEDNDHQIVYDPTLHQLNARIARRIVRTFEGPSEDVMEEPEEAEEAEDPSFQLDFFDDYPRIPQCPDDVWHSTEDVDTERELPAPRGQRYDSANCPTNSGDVDGYENTMRGTGAEFDPESTNLRGPFQSPDAVASRFIPQLPRPNPSVTHGTAYSRIFHVEIGGRRVQVNVLGPRRPVLPSAFRRPTTNRIALGRAAIQRGMESLSIRGHLPARLARVQRRPIMQQPRRVVYVRPLSPNYNARFRSEQMRRAQGGSFGRPGSTSQSRNSPHY